MKRIQLFALAAAFGATTMSAAKDIVIEINHSTGGVVYSDVLEAAKGDKISFVVIETKKSCYSYNLKQFELPQARMLLDDQEENPDTVTFSQPHDGRTTDYRISIQKRDPSDTDCNNPNFERDFRFETIGWNLSFSGAVTLDELVNPVFFLEPGSQADGMTGQTDGFFVRRNMGAEDERSVGFAVMAHLFHSNRLMDRFGFDLKWAPLTFGFGTAENSDSQLYLGTSLKFGERLYLTGGKVWGSVDRLPSNLEIGAFTEDANVLSSLGSRNKSEYFLGFSYQFGNVDLSRFTSSFTTEIPDPN